MLQSFFKEALHLIFPPQCHTCKKPLLTQTICLSCHEMITPIATGSYSLTKSKQLSVYALGHYETTLKKLILKKLISDDKAAYIIGHLMAEGFPFEQAKPDFLLPVPLHWKRYAQRGYNQSVEIARVIGKQHNIPVLPLIMRKKATLFQSSLSKEERFSNMQEAFSFNPWYKKSKSLIANKKIVLIDDLCTTGSTLVRCAQKLLPLKPKSIIGLVAARAP